MRPRRLPAPKEEAVHRTLAGLLNVALKPGWLWWHTPNGEYRDKGTAGRLKAMGVKAGVSDFILIAPPSGRVHALELKRETLKPSEAQELFMDAVRAAGGEAAWTDSFEAALQVLKGWGAVRVAS
jgi:hypothetical protein